ncbi:MFS transporter [Leptospira ognonensis]|uniref:MFS transporter n=1 Tax=Leptospira ognonensis TaxID=2484945 RepID=A0A4R9K7X2_9LEPT|nr:MFS transporter [Leptospira ognonensis]TGL61767.1 MFS transporter [Leptospira ognonensis]
MKDKFTKLGLFSLTQSFFQIGSVMMMAVTILAGKTISENPESASLPLSLVIFGTLIGLIPASYMMREVGRKYGLLIGTSIGIFGIGVVSFGLYSRNFILFSVGHLFYGLHQSFLQYLRFTAMESVPHKDRATALSWILLAGIPAAFLGPLAGLYGKDLLPNHLFLGCFLILSISLCIQFFLIANLPQVAKTIESEMKLTHDESTSRPFSYHIRNSGLWTSVLSSGIGFGLMVMLMSAVPVAMQTHGHHMHTSTIVLQWHVLGMYIPSFFSGFLVRKLGAPKLILFGIITLFLEVIAALQGTNFLPFALALILLGIGWNFMYVGGTNLLVDQYHPSEKNSIQALNDTIVYLLATVSTYSSAYLESKVGWYGLNLVALPFLAIVTILVSFHILSKHRIKPPAHVSPNLN